MGMSDIREEETGTEMDRKVLDFSDKKEMATDKEAVSEADMEGREGEMMENKGRKRKRESVSCFNCCIVHF